MATEIQRGKGIGTWQPIINWTPEPEFRPYRTAMVRCPGCGQRMSLANHTISADGMVTPSIAHPTGVPECGWHPSDAKLIGWPEENAKPLPPTPRLATCARCGRQAHTVGGWGLGWGYSDVICDKCIPEVVAAIAAGNTSVPHGVPQRVAGAEQQSNGGGA